MLQQVMLLKEADPRQTYTGWWCSEKYDGVRAFWDVAGGCLRTRGGSPVLCPHAMAETLRRLALPVDGELYAGEGRQNEVVATVQSRRLDERRWRDVRFLVFDVMVPGVPYAVRMRTLARAMPQTSDVRLVAQRVLGAGESPAKIARRVVDRGGEGIVVRDPSAHYAFGRRSAAVLKLKPPHVTKARVVSLAPPRVARLADGATFYAPLAAGCRVGDLVDVEHHGWTAVARLPRFPRVVAVSRAQSRPQARADGSP